MRMEALALAMVRLAPFGLLIALVPQAAGDFFYHRNRRIYVVPQVVAQIVVTLALLVMYVVLPYAAYGRRLSWPGCFVHCSQFLRS